MIGWVMLLQAAIPTDFDLAKLPKSEARCGARFANGEIVVCGSSVSRERLKPLEGDYGERQVRAEMGLGGGTVLGAHLEQVQLPGATSSRAMVSLSIPFGGGKKTKR